MGPTITNGHHSSVIGLQCAGITSGVHMQKKKKAEVMKGTFGCLLVSRFVWLGKNKCVCLSCCLPWCLWYQTFSSSSQSSEIHSSTLVSLTLLDKDRKGKQANEPNILESTLLSSSHIMLIRSINKKIHTFREVVSVQVVSPLFWAHLSDTLWRVLGQS